MPEGPNLRRTLICAAVALSVGLTVVSLMDGFSTSLPIRLIEAVAVFVAGAAVLGGVVGLVLVRLGGWREPESEQEFEALVQRSERLATIPPIRTEDDFDALVRTALDELPLEFHRALEHVAVVVDEGGDRYGAYGLYQGDTVAQDFFHDRIIIFRDTLMRDFGHDPELLARQVRRTVRHELAHHLGWNERGVRGLGL